MTQKTTQKDCAQEDPVDTSLEADDVGPPVPLDGGWGWVVVIGSLFCNIIVDGVCFSFGVFYPEFLHYFQESRGKTAIVGSLIPGMYLGTGPIVSALANKFGCRNVTIFGSVFAASAFFISTFSPNVDVLIFTYGILGGVGFGLMYLPSIVIVGFYFDKRRALATGLAVCGSGIGTFLFAPFGRFLLDNYGWKGGYWIISGIILNGCVCGLTFRPLEAVQRKKPKELKELKEKNQPHGLIFDKIIDEKERNRTISTGSLDGCVITRDNTLITDPEKIRNMKNTALSRLDALEEEEYVDGNPVRYKPFANGRVAKLREEAIHYRPPAPLPKDADLQIQEQRHQVQEEPIHDTNATAPLLDSDPKSLISSTRSLSFFPHSDLPPMRNRSCSESRRKQYRVSRTGEKVFLEKSRKDNKLSISHLDIRAREVARPMNRKDIFYTGSVASLREFKNSPDKDMYMASMNSIPAVDENKSGGSFGPLCSVLKEMLDFSLLKSPTFLLLCTTSILAMTGFFTPFVYITEKALKLGISEMNAAMLLSVLGMCNTMGRVICGLVSDMPWADCLLIHNVALVIAGTATCVVPFLHSFPLLVCYCVIFGFCIAAFITLRSIVLVDLLGIEKLTSSFGLLLLFQGIASLIGSPMAGAIFDATQSYQWSFIAAGVLIAVAGLVSLPIRRLAAWEERRRGGKESNYTQIMVEEPQTPT